MEMQQKMELPRKELRAEREAAEKRADDRWKARREKMAARREEMAAWRAKMDPDEKAWREKMAAMRVELAAETEAVMCRVLCHSGKRCHVTAEEGRGRVLTCPLP
jgi:hypothetical protein